MNEEQKTRRQQLRSLVKFRRQIAETINGILDRFAQLDLSGNQDDLLSDGVRVLEELMGCDFILMDGVIEGHESLAGGGRYSMLNPEAHDGDVGELANICWPIDEGTIVRKDNGFLVNRLRSISPKEARGKIQFFPQKIARSSYLHLFDDGRWWADEVFAGLVRNRWVALEGNVRRDVYRGGKYYEHSHNQSAQFRQQIQRTVSGSLSLSLTRRYWWHVALGVHKDGPRLLIPTNPKGCLEFFRDRARGERSRRAALRHWVTKHYRETEKAGLTYVREHLRGHTEFDWRDLECEIFVSAFDLEKAEEFRAEAEQWRTQRKHNRVRVRLKKHHGDHQQEAGS